MMCSVWQTVPSKILTLQKQTHTTEEQFSSKLYSFRGGMLQKTDDWDRNIYYLYKICATQKKNQLFNRTDYEILPFIFVLYDKTLCNTKKTRCTR